MKVVPTLTVSVLLASATISAAQSGRKMQPVATPAPAASDAPGFSETGGSRSPAAEPASRPRKASSLVIKDENEIITIDTDLVTIPVSVFDRNGLFIAGLRQADFAVFEDGVEQEIAYFGTTDKPITVVLLLDTSPSTSYKIAEIRDAAVAFVDQLKLEDSVMVIEFDGNVNVLTEVTRDRARIYKSIGKADFGYGTSLYDAVDFTLRKRLNSIEGRKAIVLFTDGVDTTSRKADLGSTLSVAEEADTLVFPIYYNTLPGFNSQGGFPGVLSPRGSSPEDYEVGITYLERLSRITGGRVFRPENSPAGLTSAFEGIAEELRRQYVLGYVPADRGRTGERKQIKVRVGRPNLVLRARDSYIVGSPKRPAEPRKL
jgi:Ca-activated chloride channel family protein